LRGVDDRQVKDVKPPGLNEIEENIMKEHQADGELKPCEGLDPGVEWEVEEEDLEAAAKAGLVPRRAKRYRFRVDREHFVVANPRITGREILLMARKIPPERFLLTQKLHGGRAEKVGLDESVDLTKPGVERFMTLPLDQTEGQRDA